MCENIKNDYPIELGLSLFEGSSVVKENAELKERLARYAKREEFAAEGILLKANEHSDDSLADIADRLVGSKKALAIKLRLALPLSDDDLGTLINFLTE